MAGPLTPAPLPRAFWQIAGAALALRLAVAWFLPLGVDENYATAVAREFSWSFFDHPPLGFWSPVIAAKLTGIEHPFIYRLPFLVYGMLTTWGIYRVGEALGGVRAGLWAAGLVSVAPFFALSAGVFVIPDGPLSVASVFCALVLIRIARSPDGRGTLGQWAWAGLWLALALASKYQAGLIPVSLLVLAVLHPLGRKWLASAGPWLGAWIGLLGLAPVLLWNLGNDWASFAFHSGRTGDGLQPGNFARMIVGQFLYLLPPVLVIGAAGLWQGWRNRADGVFALVFTLAVMPILVFNAIYLFSAQSFPHWTMPGWIFALALGGVWLAERGGAAMRRAAWWVGGFAVPIWALLFALIVHMNTGFITRGWDTPPDWDRTVDAFDWSGLEPALRARGDLDGINAIASVHWIEAGEMSTALRGRFPVKMLHPDQHHFRFMSGATAKGPALLLSPDTRARAEERRARLLAAAREVDPGAEMLEDVVLKRGSRDYAVVMVVRLTLP